MDSTELISYVLLSFLKGIESMGVSFDRLKKANLSREDAPRKSLWGAKSQRRHLRKAVSAIIDFLEEKGSDASGRSFGTVLAFDDAALERQHDFIQWLFPLAEESSAGPGSPILSRDDIEAIVTSQDAQWSLLRASDLMSDFYRRTDQWLRPNDHNHLRITRIIKSLRLIAGHSPADDFRQTILTCVEDTKAPISTLTHQQTTVPGLYAAGDIVHGLSQVSVAAGQAAIASTAINRALPPLRY